MKVRQSSDCPGLTSDFQPETLGRPDAYCSLYGERVLTYSSQEILPVASTILQIDWTFARHSMLPDFLLNIRFTGQFRLSPGSRHQDFPPRVTTP